MLANLQYENEQLKDELRELKENGPTWEAIKHLQQRIRNLEGQLRSERHARENILDSVKQELQNDKRFEELTPDQEDMLAEIAVLKGALANANQKLKNSKTKPKDYGSAYENDAKVEDALVHDKNPIGRFLQKWFVVANHNTQYWVSRTNAEIKKQKEVWMKEQGLSMDNNASDENNDENDKKQIEQIKTECLNWILYDTKRERLVHEVRMQGRGQGTEIQKMSKFKCLFHRVVLGLMLLVVTYKKHLHLKLFLVFKQNHVFGVLHFSPIMVKNILILHVGFYMKFNFGDQWTMMLKTQILLLNKQNRFFFIFSF